MRGTLECCTFSRSVPAQIIIMAGGGVMPSNISSLVATTGVHEVHATARGVVPSGMVFRMDPPVYMGGEKTNTPEAEYQRKETRTDIVAALVAAIK